MKKLIIICLMLFVGCQAPPHAFRYRDKQNVKTKIGDKEIVGECYRLRGFTEPRYNFIYLDTTNKLQTFVVDEDELYD